MVKLNAWFLPECEPWRETGKFGFDRRRQDEYGTGYSFFVFTAVLRHMPETRLFKRFDSGKT
jgi:hypothetical protein